MSSLSNPDNHRKYYRNRTQKVVLIVQDKPYLAHDWSPDGFSVQLTEHKYKPDDEIKGHIDVFDLDEVGEFSGIVIRHDEEGLLAVRFTQLSSHVFMNFCMNLSDTNTEPTE